ncbi:SRPBCC family protein [Plantactinospora sp. KBS50]|uniref:SRPBCC family protein n=1 Tax=Plantactinospora sp. KBS50 TaxID=2024580 RepID=UPI000BAB1986|nr:SRPBCC family protein [Plantactinospora sp. KBS50]ASW56356.1 polyketide cyclase [Plantactinospora sp. KBS50]
MINIDVDHQLSAVERRFGSRVLPAGEARVVTVSQTYDAELADVWEACTNAERIPRWFLPITGDLRPGGKFQLEGNASGTIESCDPPNSFTTTWENGGEVSWIELTLVAEAPERTRLQLEHVAHVDDEMAAQFGPGAIGIGWDMAMVGLALHLTTDEAVDPAAGVAWAGSPEGREFIRGSSERWYAANVAAGTPAEEARAAADRVTAAYTAEPPADPSAEPPA